MKIEEINTQNINSIKLPVSLRNGKVFVLRSKDALIVKKIQKFTLNEVRQKLKSARDKITEAEIDQEIQNYRQGK